MHRFCCYLSRFWDTFLWPTQFHSKYSCFACGVDFLAIFHIETGVGYMDKILYCRICNSLWWESCVISHSTFSITYLSIRPSRSVLLWSGRGYPLPGGLPANPSYHEHRAWDHGGFDQRVWLPASPSGTYVAVLSGQRPPSSPTRRGDPPSCKDGLCQAALLLQG